MPARGQSAEAVILITKATERKQQAYSYYMLTALKSIHVRLKRLKIQPIDNEHEGASHLFPLSV